VPEEAGSVKPRGHERLIDALEYFKQRDQHKNAKPQRSPRAPKVPAGIKKRGKNYYTRRRMGGRITWINLGADLEEAKRRQIEMNAERARGRPVLKVRSVTVAEAAKNWLETYVSTTRTEKNQKMAEVRVGTYLSPFMGHIVLGRMTPDDVRRYRAHLDKQGLKPNTVKHLLSDLRAMLSWAEDSGKIDRSPFPKRVMPKVKETAPKGLSTDDVARLVALPEPYGFTLRLLLGTGVRWSEACRAQADHVDRGKLVLEYTKSGRVRRVPLGRELLAEVKGRVGKLVPFAQNNPGGFARAVRRMTGIEGFHVHRTRHTYAMDWLAHGGSLAALQELLGHADLKTTAIYAKVNQDLVDREAEAVSNRRRGAEH
jgi:integrase